MHSAGPTGLAGPTPGHPFPPPVHRRGGRRTRVHDADGHTSAILRPSPSPHRPTRTPMPWLNPSCPPDPPLFAPLPHARARRRCRRHTAAVGAATSLPAPSENAQELHQHALLPLRGSTRARSNHLDRIDAFFFLGRRRCSSSIRRLCSS